ncbi:barstar family protein [Paracoccus sp. S1E-3]|uniref:barstar family protein n=1 Tax=Paracoccus sp. S1E-3 TaxID=2756130 RepID=UPI0015EF5BFE|nr:barstar family protein [Paracoccus sp. S1E-3]MBA4489267.1 barstar family protein [Paracoccus sp. S1E-3]
MTNSLVTIDGDAIPSWQAFHDTFSTKLGFPDFYGRNMDAWIDCMSSLGDADGGLTSVHLAPGEVLTIRVTDQKALQDRHPDIWAGLVDGAAFVNWRAIESGNRALIALAYHD